MKKYILDTNIVYVDRLFLAYLKQEHNLSHPLLLGFRVYHIYNSLTTVYTQRLSINLVLPNLPATKIILLPISTLSIDLN